MKTKVKYIIVCLIMCLFVCPVYASYTYEVYTYGSSKTLHDEETILVDQQGGMMELALSGSSTADVKSTSILSEGVGGIWTINIVNDSSLVMSGGQVHEIAIGNGDATAFLSGGLIQQIWSSQIPLKWDDNNQQWIPNPHITIVYSGSLPTVQEIYGLDHLVGNWGNGDPFSIYLQDTGYDVYGNFDFVLVPEPATLLLLGLGGLALYRQLERNLPFQRTGGEV